MKNQSRDFCQSKFHSKLLNERPAHPGLTIVGEDNGQQTVDVAAAGDVKCSLLLMLPCGEDVDAVALRRGRRCCC